MTTYSSKGFKVIYYFFSNYTFKNWISFIN